MPKTLITGANRGLGYTTARRLSEAGHDVWIGARDLEHGRAAAEEVGVNVVELDVTSNDSVSVAAEAVRAQAGHLDVLINNAGILGGLTRADEVTVEQMQAVFDTNVFGIVRVTKAFLPLLRKAEAPSVINVTSGLGSFALTHDPDRVESQFTLIPYNSSKSAVTMITMQYAKALPDIRFNAVDPGQTATEFTGHAGQPVEQGVEPIVHLATLGAHTPTGTFTDRDGAVPW
jgi:NAD(P)-dependent dehydrogenase (short-subunit alcohol dehydrogenase family)